MDFALQAALLGAVMGSAILAISTVYGWTLPNAPRGWGWWSAAFVVEAASKVMLLGGGDFVELSDFSHSIGGGLILCAAGAFTGRRLGPGAVAAAMSGGVLWTLVAQIPRQTFELLELPLLGYGGLPLLASAWVFARLPLRTDAHKIVAATFAVSGVHHLAAPLLLAHPTPALWSLLLSQFLAMVLSVALLLVVLRRQQAYAESEGARANLLHNRLIDALSSVQDGIALFDGNDRLVTFNDRYREFLAPLAQSVQPGARFEDIINGIAARKLVSGGREKDWAWDLLADHAAGSIAPREQQMQDGRWLAVSVYRTADGGHLRILRDVTNRKQAELALSESAAWLKGIMDSVGEGIVTIDETGTVLSFNPSAQRIFGFAADEVVGRNVNMLMPEPFHSDHDGYLARYLQTGERRMIGIGKRIVGQRKDGTVFPVELAVSEMIRGDMITFIGVVRDITESKRVEDALVESERRFRAQAFHLQIIIDNMAQGVAVFDGTEKLVALNEVARNLLGINHARAAVATVDFPTFLMLLSEDDNPETAARLLATTRQSSAAVFEHTTVAGWVLEVRSTPMPGGGLILTFTDITARKRVEEALREAKEAAERGNRAKATFLANISHELRTPLNAIIGFSELMKHEIFGPLEPADYRNYVDDIHESGMHLLELINDILDMSKAEAGMTDLVESPVDITTIVRSSVRMMARRADSSRITLAEDLPSDLPFIRADERRIRQIVLNLLSNAVKFTDDNGRVTIKARHTADGLEVSVTDTGIGMSPEDLVKVMEPFVQADTRLSRKYEGTGLGLPLTKALVDAHGGTFRLTSEPGKGTTATVIFPPARVLTTQAVLAEEG